MLQYMMTIDSICHGLLGEKFKFLLIYTSKIVLVCVLQKNIEKRKIIWLKMKSENYLISMIGVCNFIQSFTYITT